MKDMILIGGGGHCKSVIDTIREGRLFNIIGILDIKEKVGHYVCGIKIIGTDDELARYYKEGVENGFITLGSIGNCQKRITIYHQLKEIGMVLPVIKDKTSVISASAVIGEGTFVGKGAVINTDVTIGENCIINTGAVVEHDCILEDFVHISPGSILSGGVTIGRNTHVGTQSTIIQNIEVGENTIIGAGSVVVKNISKNRKAYGNPCREVEECQKFLS